MFSLLDAASGFWQIPLEKETSQADHIHHSHGEVLDLQCTGDFFQREMSVLFRGQEGFEVYMDDILLHGRDEKEHKERLQNVLQILESAGLRLNDRKCCLCQKQLNYLGHLIDEEGICPDPSKVSAITELQPPDDMPGLRRFLGMVHYLGRYLPNLSEVIKPLNGLLKTDAVWTWYAAQVDAFNKGKQLISTASTLAFYDVSKPTIVSADACSFGLGGVLLQRHVEGLKPVAFCSRTLTDAERYYMQIGTECLAVVWACERFSTYLYGLDSFTVQTDHKPLAPLINNKDLNMVPLRCKRLLMRLMRYNPTAEYVPGKTLTVADTLSRQPLSVIQSEISELTCDVSVFEDAAQAAWSVLPSKLERIKQETSTTVTCRW